MAKHTPLNVSSFYAATLAAVIAGNDETTTTETASTLLANASVDECVETYVVGSDTEAASRAGKKAAILKARELLDADGIDVTDEAAMVEVLWPALWRKLVGKGQPTKGKTEASLQFYERNHKKAERMAQAIAKIDAPQAAAVRVPREALEAATILVAYEAKVQKEALKRARDAAKKAKAKAAKTAE